MQALEVGPAKAKVDRSFVVADARDLVDRGEPFPDDTVTDSRDARKGCDAGRSLLRWRAGHQLSVAGPRPDSSLQLPILLFGEVGMAAAV